MAGREVIRAFGSLTACRTGPAMNGTPSEVPLLVEGFTTS
jgi:hypothetical protein